MVGASVKIDHMGCLIQDLGPEKIGNAARQGALLAARKTAIEVAAVRHVAGLVEKTEHVDDRHHQQRPAQALESGGAQQPTGNLNAIDLVAVNSATDQRVGPGRRPWMTSTGICRGVCV